MAENAKVEKIESISRSSVSVVFIDARRRARRTPARSSTTSRLSSTRLATLPQGAGPVEFIKDFGDTAALMLTVASPKADDVELGLRARADPSGDRDRPAPAPGPGHASRRASACRPSTRAVAARTSRPASRASRADEARQRRARRSRAAASSASTSRRRLDDATRPALWRSAFIERAARAGGMPSRRCGEPIVVRDPAQTRGARWPPSPATSTAIASSTIHRADRSARCRPCRWCRRSSRTGVLQEQVYLDYSQERLASYGVHGSRDCPRSSTRATSRCPAACSRSAGQER